ncbi:RNA polymerase sigma factor for flagellar operon FliA [Marinobacter segnicrescens]|uniref:RNA polymerase sigma factor for flagellar operon FliA n=1 Tax=Marinobacter segnicrescens TaxID=430453 RepID=A0A1I0H7Q3_9GAMM|nr:sigma factor-like helix-turn-helix DNA-binding protein [Marinobacter segnicrescens]SET79627.1 RNA polymerase sigma factor for flagellar operon FliA [Marinobacter segnicrescens]
MKNANFQKFQPLIKQVIKSMQSQRCSMLDDNDMTQIALITLGGIDDLDSASPAFVFNTIRNRIIDEKRRLDWRPRQVRQAAYELLNTESELSKKLGRDPSDSEISEALGVSVEDVREMRLDTQPLTSFEDMEWSNSLTSGGGYEDIEVLDLFKSLPERNRKVMEMCYSQGMKLREIAGVLGCTEARISQLHKQSIQKLAAHF